MKISSKKLNENTDEKEIISFARIPENDPLRRKPLEKGRHTDILSTIDRSNNFSANPNSIYLNIMQYLTPKLEKKDIIPSETATPLSNRCKKDKETKEWASRRERNIWTLKSLKSSPYRLILFNSNQADYFLYLKHPEKACDFGFGLVYNISKHYLVPAKQLRNQISDALNDIKKGNFDNFLEVNGSYLDERIVEGYSFEK